MTHKWKKQKAQKNVDENDDDADEWRERWGKGWWRGESNSTIFFSSSSSFFFWVSIIMIECMDSQWTLHSLKYLIHLELLSSSSSSPSSFQHFFFLSLDSYRIKKNVVILNLFFVFFHFSLSLHSQQTYLSLSFSLSFLSSFTLWTLFIIMMNTIDMIYHFLLSFLFQPFPSSLHLPFPHSLSLSVIELLR